MKEKQVEKALKTMADLKAQFAPLEAQVKEMKGEYADLENAVAEWAEEADFRGDKFFEHGSVKVTSGKGKLVLDGAASFDEACVNARKLKMNRFIRTKHELIKNRVKDEMPPDKMKEIGVAVVREPSIKVEVF